MEDPESTAGVFRQVATLEPPRPGDVLVFQGRASREEVRAFKRALAEKFPAWAAGGGALVVVPPDGAFASVQRETVLEMLTLLASYGATAAMARPSEVAGAT